MLTAGLALLLLGLVAAVLVGVGAANAENGIIDDSAANAENGTIDHSAANEENGGRVEVQRDRAERLITR